MSMIVLGGDPATKSVVNLGEQARARGLYVIGINGTGKTSFLINLIAQDAKAGHGLCFLDPHGDASYDILARLPENRIDDVIFLDASDAARPFGVNFYEVADPTNEKDVAKRAEQAIGVFKKLWGQGEQASWGPRLEDLLRIISYTFIQNPGCMMTEIPLVLGGDEESRSFRSRLVTNVTSADVRRYWADFEMLDRRFRTELVFPVLNKVRPFILNPLIRNIVGQPTTTVNMRSAMDEGKIVLVRLPIGELDDGPVNLLGSMLVGLVAIAAFSRATVRERRSFYLYADEYQRFATRDFAVLLAEARKYKVATTIAHQDRSQLRQIGEEVAKIKAANIVVFQVDGEDAAELALQFDCSPLESPVKLEYVPVGVIDYLLREGHRSTVVVHFIEEFLRLLNDAGREGERYVSGQIVYGQALFPYTDLDSKEQVDRYMYASSGVQEGLRTLNTMLHRVMDQQRLPATLPGKVVGSFAQRLGYCSLVLSTTSTNLNDVPDEHQVARLCLPPAQIQWQRMISTKVQDVLVPVFGSLEHYKEQLREAKRTSNQYAMVQGAQSLKATSQWLSKTEHRVRSLAEREAGRAKPFLESLWQAMTVLMQERIVTDSGLGWQQMLQQTHADRQNQVANELKQQPIRTARIRIDSAQGPIEHTLRVLPLGATISPASLMQRRARVLAGADRYTRPIVVVEQQREERLKSRIQQPGMATGETPIPGVESPAPEPWGIGESLPAARVRTVQTA